MTGLLRDRDFHGRRGCSTVLRPQAGWQTRVGEKPPSHMSPLQVPATPGEIDWDAISEDLAEEFLALNARLVALQPSTGGLVVDQDGGLVE